MNVQIFGKDAQEIKEAVLDSGLKIVDKNPEAVISFGGDGTFLSSEYNSPGVPKLILKHSKVCKLCSTSLTNNELLKHLASGNFFVKELYKLTVETKSSGKGQANAKKLEAVSDIIIHNADPRHCIRYEVEIKDFFSSQKEIIGDGLVIATPIGSGGYYRSITDSIFNVGIGIAFNNSTEQSDHMVVSDNSQIEIKITRGPVFVYADNQSEYISLGNEDHVTIKKSARVAKIIEIK